MTDRLQGLRQSLRDYSAQHFLWSTGSDGRVAVVRLNRPERKNPLTFESYIELRDVFRALAGDRDIRAVVLTGEGGNFCSGGDVFEIIGPLTEMSVPDLLAFTRLTGDLVKAMRACPQPIIAAVDGVAAGAGAILAMASDLRVATPRTSTAFLFTRVGLAGCDMGACALLPRIIGQGRASELLYLGRSMTAAEGQQWGFWNAVVEPDALHAEALAWAERIAHGPGFAHAMTKTMLSQEWSVSVEQAIEMEAQAQALCMGTQDFRRAFEAFAAKRSPVFEGD
jgi:enoyl-CoA hydratase/carnithine racemase